MAAEVARYAQEASIGNLAGEHGDDVLAFEVSEG